MQIRKRLPSSVGLRSTTTSDLATVTTPERSMAKLVLMPWKAIIYLKLSTNEKYISKLRICKQITSTILIFTCYYFFGIYTFRFAISKKLKSMRASWYENYRNVMVKNYSNKDSTFTLNSVSSLVTSLEIASLTPLIEIDDKFKAPSCLNCCCFGKLQLKQKITWADHAWDGPDCRSSSRPGNVSFKIEIWSYS